MNLPWLIRMAWRDGRRRFSRLLLFISSVILGIAALVSIFALSETLSREIDQQAAALLGADLEIESNKKMSDSLLQAIAAIKGEKAEQRSFASMAYFPSTGSSRLIQVRALEGNYPFYGSLETSPAAAGNTFQQTGTALVDKALLLQFSIKLGDSVRIGEKTFRIGGQLNGAPGQTGLAASLAPVVYIPLQALAATELDQKGSRVSQSVFVRLPDPSKAASVARDLETLAQKEGADVDTVENQKEQSARSFRDLTRFLSLIGFIALLLGCIGVASAIQIYAREKIASIAILRCLGASSRQAFLIFLIQIVVMGTIGSLIGVVLGNLLQTGLPILLKDVLPVSIQTGFSWIAAAKGLLLGILVSLLFALLPLSAIRNISPLNTLRMAVQKRKHTDPVQLLLIACILLFIVSFSRWQLRNWKEALIFSGGLLAAFGALAGMAKGLMWMVRTYLPKTLPFIWRQGASNLHRPNNQTSILLISIGLGTALISLLVIIQQLLLDRVSLSASGNQPNMILFDIQTDQRTNILQEVRQMGLPADATVPIVTMRLESVNQINAESLRKDSSLPIKKWVFSREYRVTFRDSLIASERIHSGQWIPRATGSIIPVSVEEGFARRNAIRLGDTLTFNVQGTMLTTIVGSLRKVDWNRIQTNFLVVFPAGVLEQAPQFHVLITRTPDAATAARVQQRIVERFPNVSVVDLTLILNIVDVLLNKIGFVIRFLSGFCLITGLIVLIASVLISKYQRVQESVLLRTLGATRRQIYKINAVEYAFIGLLATGSGAILAVLAGWAMASFSFDIPFRPDLLPIIGIILTITVLTILIGLFNIRFIISRSPLEVWRQE